MLDERQSTLSLKTKGSEAVPPPGTLAFRLISPREVMRVDGAVNQFATRTDFTASWTPQGVIVQASRRVDGGRASEGSIGLVLSRPEVECLVHFLTRCLQVGRPY